MEAVDEESFSCPVCGEVWASSRGGGETRLRFMNRHERLHEGDIPARFFWENNDEIDTMVENP